MSAHPVHPLGLTFHIQPEPYTGLRMQMAGSLRIISAGVTKSIPDPEQKNSDEVNDRHLFSEMRHWKKCVNCKALSSKLKQCSRCKQVNYCGVECQRLHWTQHKHECGKLRYHKTHLDDLEPEPMQITDEMVHVNENNVVRFKNDEADDSFLMPARSEVEYPFFRQTSPDVPSGVYTTYKMGFLGAGGEPLDIQADRGIFHYV